MEDYHRIYAFSLAHPDEFWGQVARSRILWRKPWSRVCKPLVCGCRACNPNLKSPTATDQGLIAGASNVALTRVSEWNYHSDRDRCHAQWYPGAELNVAENCVDRHVAAGRGNHTALIWVGNQPGEERKFTFQHLYEEVCRVAHLLESLGIKKGDRVGIYLPNIPELALSMLACARIGAIHSVVFGGFSAHSIQSRMNDCGAKLIITTYGTSRGEKWIELKSHVDEALSMGSGCPTIEHVLVIDHLPTQKTSLSKPGKIDVSWTSAIQPFTPHIAPSHLAEDPLFILYTSGSTGKPKGVLHAMGGYLTYSAYTHDLVFQPQPDDVYWCTADLGWITGHSYLLYGPLANGITTLMYEGVPHYPTPSRFWEVTDQYKVNIFYTAPTAIRILAGAGNVPVQRTSRASLRTLGTVGEPINPEAWKWYSSIVGEDRCPIVDTWWQTETGGIMISPLAGITPTQPGSATLPLPGIEPILLNEDGTKLSGETHGALVIARSWPGQMTGVYGDENRFRETYLTQYPGYYFTGDGAKRDASGNYWILGRTDDVIKIAGHRLGTAEIESACILDPRVLESGAVGVPDPVTGEALHVFVVFKDPSTPPGNIPNELILLIRKAVGPVATPKKIHLVPGLPKTRSGKIMRRILKKLALGHSDDLGDLSTLADPSIIQKMIVTLKPTPQMER